MIILAITLCVGLTFVALARPAMALGPARKHRKPRPSTLVYTPYDDTALHFNADRTLQDAQADKAWNDTNHTVKLHLPLDVPTPCSPVQWAAAMRTRIEALCTYFEDADDSVSRVVNFPGNFPRTTILAFSDENARLMFKLAFVENPA